MTPPPGCGTSTIFGSSAATAAAAAGAAADPLSGTVNLPVAGSIAARRPPEFAVSAAAWSQPAWPSAAASPAPPQAQAPGVGFSPIEGHAAPQAQASLSPQLMAGGGTMAKVAVRSAAPPKRNNICRVEFMAETSLGPFQQGRLNPKSPGSHPHRGNSCRGSRDA